jgi:filamentous hemagglutinin family protein
MKILNNSFFLLFYCISKVIILGQDYPRSLQDDEQRGRFSLYGVVQGGEASFSSVGEELQITASDGALIDYYNFDIPAGETVRFIQPGSDSAVINRISGQTPSLIDGNLFGNGKVVLLNPFGIVFGESAVVEVGKLHAIAGMDMQQSFALSGSVSNAGSIQASEVVLAGTSVTNTGMITVDEGSLVMATGAELQLMNEDNSLSVSLSAESKSPLGGASDIAGQAILQSGVVRASKAQFHGNSIIHSGSTSAATVSVNNYSSFTSTDEDSGQSGSLVTNELSITGGLTQENNPSFELSGKSNTVSKLTVLGNHQDLEVRSTQSLQVGESVTRNEQIPNEDEGDDVPSVLVQNMDLRVDEGDLTLHVLLTPTLTTSDNSLLLAAENDLVLPANLESFTHSRKILYGRNLGIGTIEQEDNLALGSTVSLDAISVFIDDLSPTLSASVIQALARDNPTFEGFDSKGGLVELSQMTEDQLNMLFKYGLFTGYSYFFEAPDKSAKLANDLEEAGGSSALFGGSFAVLASTGGSSSSDSSGDGDSEEGDEGSSSSASSSANTSARAVGVAPFAPISQPILSVEASVILEKALAPEIEQKMQTYLNP